MTSRCPGEQGLPADLSLDCSALEAPRGTLLLLSAGRSCVPGGVGKRSGTHTLGEGARSRECDIAAGGQVLNLAPAPILASDIESRSTTAVSHWSVGVRSSRGLSALRIIDRAKVDGST